MASQVVSQLGQPLVPQQGRLKESSTSSRRRMRPPLFWRSLSGRSDRGSVHVDAQEWRPMARKQPLGA